MSMKRKTHLAVHVLIYAGLFIIVVLLFHDPRFTASEATVNGGPGQDSIDIPDTRVRCESTIMLGWPTDRAYPDEYPQSSNSWDADLPSMPAKASAGISADLQQECTERRDTYLGFIIIVAVPTTALMAVAISRSLVRAEQRADDLEDRIKTANSLKP